MSEAFKKFEDMLTPEQRAMLDQPKAWQRNQHPNHPLGTGPFPMTGHFHMLCKIETPEQPIVPSVSLREQRLRFILEEFLELVEACGFKITIPGWDNGDWGKENDDVDCGKYLVLKHIEGSRYDVVEVGDALGDLNVVNNGTGVEFGLPMHFIDYEVYCSNLSKVPVGGDPIKNGITEGYRAGDSKMTDWPRENEPGFRPDLPIGKILKPESYVAPNIPAVLKAYIEKEI